MDSSTEIEEQAGAWLARRDSGEWSAEEQARFEQWLKASTAHRVALLRLEEMWDRALRLQALGTGTVPSPDEWRSSPFFQERQFRTLTRKPRLGRWGLALAASALLAITVTFAWKTWPRQPSFATPVGGTASIPMSDGSRVTLNTDSKIRVDITNDERHVVLERGEAFFEVAQDSARPFVVIAGSRRVTALGTEFSVRRTGDEVDVIVSGGRVRVEDRSKLGSVDAAVLVSAGGIVRAGRGGVVMQQDAASQVEDSLSWRAGYLVFREVPLALAVAEFNRYNEQKITIEDPAVESLRVSGKIRATNSDAFLRLVQDGFAIKVQRLDGRISLTESK